MWCVLAVTLLAGFGGLASDDPKLAAKVYERGTLLRIEMLPGTDRLSIDLVEQRKSEPPVWLVPDDVTFDGKKVTAAELVAKIMTAKGDVRFESLTDTTQTYGAVRKARFMSLPPPK